MGSNLHRTSASCPLFSKYSLNNTFFAFCFSISANSQKFLLDTSLEGLMVPLERLLVCHFYLMKKQRFKGCSRDIFDEPKFPSRKTCPLLDGGTSTRSCSSEQLFAHSNCEHLLDAEHKAKSQSSLVPLRIIG